MDGKDIINVSGQEASDTRDKKAKKTSAPKEMQFSNGAEMRAFANGRPISILKGGRYFFNKDGQQYFCTIKKHI